MARGSQGYVSSVPRRAPAESLPFVPRCLGGGRGLLPCPRWPPGAGPGPTALQGRSSSSRVGGGCGRGISGALGGNGGLVVTLPSSCLQPTAPQTPSAPAPTCPALQAPSWSPHPPHTPIGRSIAGKRAQAPAGQTGRAPRQKVPGEGQRCCCCFPSALCQWLGGAGVTFCSGAGRGGSEASSSTLSKRGSHEPAQSLCAGSALAGVGGGWWWAGLKALLQTGECGPQPSSVPGEGSVLEGPGALSEAGLHPCFLPPPCLPTSNILCAPGVEGATPPLFAMRGRGQQSQARVASFGMGAVGPRASLDPAASHTRPAGLQKGSRPGPGQPSTGPSQPQALLSRRWAWGSLATRRPHPNRTPMFCTSGRHSKKPLSFSIAPCSKPLVPPP